jgi:pyrroline-5-carboxylate reductase
MQLVIVGGGRMGEALLGGLVAAGWEELGVVEKLPSRRDELAARYPQVDVLADVPAADAAVLATKPHDIRDACAGLAGTKRVLSIAAGITIASLEKELGAGTAVVRAMPNLPAVVGAGVAAIAPGTAAGDADLEWAASVLGAVGAVVSVPERLLDAVTGVSGSGPAYLFLVAEALIEAGVLNGLPRDVATTLALHTVLGAGRMLTELGETPEALRTQVTTPGGTTAAALHVFEAAGLRAAFLDAVSAATARARELGA